MHNTCDASTAALRKLAIHTLKSTYQENTATNTSDSICPPVELQGLCNTEEASALNKYIYNAITHAYCSQQNAIECIKEEHSQRAESMLQTCRPMLFTTLRTLQSALTAVLLQQSLGNTATQDTNVPEEFIRRDAMGPEGEHSLTNTAAQGNGVSDESIGLNTLCHDGAASDLRLGTLRVAVLPLCVGQFDIACEPASGAPREFESANGGEFFNDALILFTYYTGHPDNEQSPCFIHWDRTVDSLPHEALSSDPVSGITHQLKQHGSQFDQRTEPTIPSKMQCFPDLHNDAVQLHSGGISAHYADV